MRRMRTQLAPLEGETVVFVGRAVEHRRRDGRIYMLLSNVKLWRADPDLCLDTDPPVTTVDHVWVNGLPEEMQSGEMLTHRSGGARVGLYARAGGSIDYGLTLLPSVYLDRFNNDLFGITSREEAVGKLSSLLHSYDEGTGVFYGLRRSPKAWIKHFRRQHAKEAASAAATLATSFTGPNNGPCRALKAALRLPKQTRSVAKGFA